MDPDSTCNYFLNASNGCEYSSPNGCEYSSPSQVANTFHNDAHSFSIMHLNSRSLLPKLNIQLLLHQLPATICAISETWLTDSMSDTIGISGNKFLHKSRVGVLDEVWVCSLGRELSFMPLVFQLVVPLMPMKAYL